MLLVDSERIDPRNFFCDGLCLEELVFFIYVVEDDPVLVLWRDINRALGEVDLLGLPFPQPIFSNQ